MPINKYLCTRRTAFAAAFFLAAGCAPVFAQAYRFNPEHRRPVSATLRDLQAAFGGERRAVVARELTKAGEEFVRGSLGELVARFAARAPVGQCVLLVEGAGEDRV